MYKESHLEYLHKGIGEKTPIFHLNVSWKVQSQEERSWTVLISTTPRVLGNCERETEASQISSFLLQARTNREQLHPCLPKLNHSDQQTSVWGIIIVFLHTGISLWKAVLLLILTVMKTSTPKCFCHHLFQEEKFFCLQAKLVAFPSMLALQQKQPEGAAVSSGWGTPTSLPPQHTDTLHGTPRCELKASLSAPSHSSCGHGHSLALSSRLWPFCHQA